MADKYDFTEEQRQLIADLLDGKNQSLWAAVLYDIPSGDGKIVVVALSQIGNVGGQPFRDWYQGRFFYLMHIGVGYKLQHAFWKRQKH